ncbi:Head-to-tail connector protein, podovirus-type [uncultured Caudovirales phage]|uniref:Head-to-tail connector protein, podovirus-type n=1 Tax=uncultured Caudovirales phage TaxID=2100421 RepID=A0A6J5NAC1_9CAUD|nr:Head-to-tail connector protein, podovirus-type [uncultured Caudovirales phage]
MLCERYDALLKIRAPWDTLWEEISRYVMPRRAPGQYGTLTPNNEKESRLFDTTAVQANMILANGCMAWMSPMEGAWFASVPQAHGGPAPDDLKQWHSTATERTRNKLAVSNFYTAIHEFYLDRSAFGTACLFQEPGKNNGINVQCWSCGTFVIDEDENGDVDTVVRSFKLTARQAVLKFGEGQCHELVRKAAADGGASAMKQFEFLHFIMPRTERDAEKQDAMNLPIASIYLDKENSHVCREGGYRKMPCQVSRYLEWGTGFGGLYGWSPSFAALPEARQVNFLQKMMDALAEKAAFPPVLAPEELEGEIDPNAFGVTYFSASMAAGAMPKEWMTQGRYDVGKDRVKERQEAINRAFHVDLFQMFSQLEKQMTAREVSERSSEKLIQFSPTFARLVTELFNPLLDNIYDIGFHLGWYPELPQSAADAPEWQVEYTSRIAQALRSLPVLAIHRMVEMLSAMAPLNPGVIDNVNFDEAIRLIGSVDSMPEGVMRPKAEVDKGRKAQADAQAKQMQMEQASVAAKAASDVGRIPAESPVGNIIASNLPGVQAA